MIEKPKRPKQPSIQERQPPRTLQELINRYDLDNTKIYDFLDELVNQVNNEQDNLQSQINNKSIITARLNSNTDISVSTAWYSSKVFLTNIEQNLGDCFVFENGAVTIKKSGYYTINGNISITSGGGRTMIGNVSRNNVVLGQMYQYSETNNQYVGLAITPRCVWLNKDDVITLNVSASAIGTYRMAGGAYTYMTIEHIK